MEKNSPPEREPEGRRSKRPRQPQATPHRGQPQLRRGLDRVGPYGLTERVWRALRTGQGLAPGYSGTGWLVGAMVAAELPESVITKLLLDTGNDGAALFHTRSSGKPRSYGEASGMVRRAIASKRAWLASDSRRAGDGAEAIAYAASVISEATDRAEDWRGQGGATNLAVLVALAAMAEKSAKWNFHGSVRAVAEDAGVGVATATRAIHRLMRAGWVDRKTEGSGDAASTYRLRVPARRVPEGGTEVERTRLSLRGTTPRAPSVSPPTDDAWRWGGGLGKAAWRTYTALSDEPIPTSVLASALGLTPRSARRSAGVLVGYGLARNTPDGWLRGEADPATVGASLAIAGVGARQREQHRIHRENRARWLAEARGRRVMRATTTYTTVALPDGGTVLVASRSRSGAA